MIQKIGIPKCYKDFHCIAEKCTDSCCAGWQVDVDEASWEYYKTVQGEFGGYLHSVMVEVPEAEGQFRLREDGRCPFLNDTGLCDLFSNLGEHRLCKTCTNYPRYMEEYGTLREVGIAFSCPEAARLMLSDSRPMEFEEITLGPDADQWCDTAKDVMWRTAGMGASDMAELMTNREETAAQGFIVETETFDESYFNMLYEGRKTAFFIVQQRTLSIEQRVLLYLDYAVALQQLLDDWQQGEDDSFKVNLLVREYGNEQWLCKRWQQLYEEACRWDADADGFQLYGESVPFGEVRYHLLPEFAAVLYGELKHCKPQWGPMLAEAEKVLKESMTPEEYAKTYRDFDTFFQGREYEYEHLLSYFVFKYFLKAYFDDDVYGKAQLAAVGYLMVKQLGVCHWVTHKGKFDRADQAELFHLYSREMEHSDENYETFVDSLKMENMCNFEHLMALLTEEGQDGK